MRPLCQFTCRLVFINHMLILRLLPCRQFSEGTHDFLVCFHEGIQNSSYSDLPTIKPMLQGPRRSLRHTCIPSGRTVSNSSANLRSLSDRFSCLRVSTWPRCRSRYTLTHDAATNPFRIEVNCTNADNCCSNACERLLNAGASSEFSATLAVASLAEVAAALEYATTLSRPDIRLSFVMLSIALFH